MRALGLGLWGAVVSAYKLTPTLMKTGGIMNAVRESSKLASVLPRGNKSLWLGQDEKDGSALEIVRMDLSDLSHYHYDWALKEKWTPAKGSLDPVYALSVEGRGFYALKKNERTIATVSAIEYPTQKTAFVGFFICDKDFRGQGYGKTLWEKVIGDLQKEGYVISLDCLDHMLPVYQKLGFHRIGYDVVWNYVEEQKQELAALRQEFSSMHILDSRDSETLDAIVAFDAQNLLDSSERKAFLAKWIQKDATQTIVAKDPNGQIMGYGVLSRRLTADKGEFGYRIGPLVVSDERIGLAIVTDLKKMAGAEPVFMDTCDSHQAARRLAELGSFKAVVKLNRMSTQADAVHQVPDAGFGLTSLAYSPY